MLTHALRAVPSPPTSAPPLFATILPPTGRSRPAATRTPSTTKPISSFPSTSSP